MNCPVAMAIALTSLLPTCAFGQVIAENFTDPANLLSRGWATVNRSQNPDPGGAWGPGGGLFDPPPSAPNGSYWATDTTATSVPGSTVSDWLFCPTISTLRNGDTVRFWTRTRNPEEGPSRLEIRLSLNGSSINVGTTATSTGDFGIVLGTINPALTPDAYPTAWTQFTFTVSGISGTPSGRIAFRTFYPNGGFASGTNGDTVGIDSFLFTPIPEPGTLLMSAAGLIAVWRGCRRSSRS